jgi:hypothetical protein
MPTDYIKICPKNRVTGNETEKITKTRSIEALHGHTDPKGDLLVDL